MDPKNILAVVSLCGVCLTVLAWTSGKIDPYVATEYEVLEIAAGKNDVNHVINMMVDEQIGDALLEIEAIEDSAEPDTKRKKRLERDIKKYKKGYVEDGHKHGEEYD